MDEDLRRALTPTVTGVLVRRGADFAAAEDAVQDALVDAVRTWPHDPPRDPPGWLVTVAWRRFLDAARADTGAGGAPSACNRSAPSGPQRPPPAAPRRPPGRTRMRRTAGPGS